MEKIKFSFCRCFDKSKDVYFFTKKAVQKKLRENYKFVCDKYNKGFNRKSHIIDHLLSCYNLNKKDHVCQLCGKKKSYRNIEFKNENFR